MNKYTVDTKQAWIPGSEEPHKEGFDLSGYDYRSFSVNDDDVLWAWVFAVFAVVLSLAILLVSFL